MIYGADPSGLYKLWEVQLDNHQSNIILAGDYQMVMPRIDDQGRVIYAKMKDNVNIWSYDLKDKKVSPWYTTKDLNLNPSISPSGRTVCFTTNLNGAFQIWTADINGSKAKPITDFVGQYLNTPRWSIDEKYLVFQGYNNGQSDIYQVNALGGIPFNLTQSDSDDQTPIYASGDIVYFSSFREGQWGIWNMDLSKNQYQELVVGDNAYAPQINVAGTIIYYCKKDKKGLWSYTIITKEEQLLTEEFLPMHAGAFDVVSEGLYFYNARNKQIEFLDFDSGDTQLVYRPLKRIARMGISLSVSEKEQTLLFSQIDENDADIMALEKIEL